MKALRLDRRATLPVYYQLKEWLRERIEGGALKPHSQHAQGMNYKNASH
jgi:DNA-binding GntR family transcriptional regulator